MTAFLRRLLSRRAPVARVVPAPVHIDDLIRALGGEGL